MNKFLSFLFLLLIIAGCSNSATNEKVNKTPKELRPPEVHFEIEETSYSTEQGSFCWRNENSAECLHLSLPADLAANTKPVKISRKETITLLLDRPPSEQTLTLENTDTRQFEEVALNKENKFKAPETSGIYILTYYAIWEKDKTGTSGDSSYVFKIEVK